MKDKVLRAVLMDTGVVEDRHTGIQAATGNVAKRLLDLERQQKMHLPNGEGPVYDGMTYRTGPVYKTVPVTDVITAILEHLDLDLSFQEAGIQVTKREQGE